jgi:hypothetical protein
MPDRRDRDIRFRCKRCRQLVMSDDHKKIDPFTRTFVDCK